MTSNRQGFSLIEILIAMGILSIIGMALMELITTSYKAQNFTEAKLEESELLRKLAMDLSITSTCNASFKNRHLAVDGNVASTGAISQLVDAAGVKIVGLNDKIGNNSLKITDLKVTVPMDRWTAFNNAKSNPALFDSLWLDGQLNIKLEKLKAIVGGKEVTKTLAIKFKVKSSDIIEQCYSLSQAGTISTAQETCTQIGGVFDLATSSCNFSQDCNTTDPNKPVSAKCITVVQSQVTDLNTKLIALEKELTALKDSGAGTPQVTPTPSGWSLTNPGKGCNGMSCFTSDYGPCKGMNCTTNGNFCDGLNCVACGPTATCSTMNCCAGPNCGGCDQYK